MIHIVGLGGVGFWLTVGLSRFIPPNQIVCWDNDTLAGGTGAARLPWGPEATKKVDLLRGFLLMTFADTVLPTFISRRYSGLSRIAEGDLVIDCTDMPLATRKRMWSSTRRHKANILRVSYDGRGSVVVVSTGLPLHAPPTGGYAAVPSLALSLAAGGIGAEAVKRYLDAPVPSFTTVLSIEEALK